MISTGSAFHAFITRSLKKMSSGTGGELRLV